MTDINKSAEIMREQLASISITEDTLKDEEKLARSTAAEYFYKTFFKEEIDRMIFEQLKFMGMSAQNLEQFMFGRGTVNGLSLIKDWFEIQVNKSLSRFDKSETVE